MPTASATASSSVIACPALRAAAKSSSPSAALFALGYWAGCRVSDVSWLRVEEAQVGPKVGWLRVGHKGGKWRDIDLVNEARRPLHAYLRHGGRDPESAYVFTSQRAERLTEAGIHHWFRRLKARATRDEWHLIHDITFAPRDRNVGIPPQY